MNITSMAPCVLCVPELEDIHRLDDKHDFKMQIFLWCCKSPGRNIGEWWFGKGSCRPAPAERIALSPKFQQSCKKYIPIYERGIETKVHIKRNQSGSTFAMVKCRFESVETRLSSYTIANTTRRSYRNYYLMGTRVKRKVVE